MVPVSSAGPADFPAAYAHMLALSERLEFARHLGTYLDWYRKQLAGES